MQKLSTERDSMAPRRRWRVIFIRVRDGLERARRLAAGQDGVISRAQALDCGLTDRAIRCHLKAGRWQYVFDAGRHGRRPGVYATFSGPIGRPARRWAAVLVCGPGAVLSHETAAELLGLYDTPSGRWAERAPIHVTVPAGRAVKPPPGVRCHYSTRLDAARHPARHPPCTRLEETVADLTQTAQSVDRASAVIAEAIQKRMTTHDRIVAVLRDRKKLRWRRELLESCGVVASGAQSLLEVKYVRRVERAHRLPAAERQKLWKHDGHGFVIDNRYAGFRTRVELDGQRGHTGNGAFRDLWRDNAATLADERQLRFGWDDVTDRACETAAAVAKVLADNGFAGTIGCCGPDCRAEATFQRLLRRPAA